MKKIIPFFIVISLLFCCLSMSVSAAETPYPYFSVLDYAGMNGSVSNSVSFNSSTVFSYNLSSTYGSFTAYSVEFTVSYSGSTPSLSTFTLNGNPASSVRVDYIGNSVFKYRLKFDGAYGSVFNVGFTSSGQTKLRVLGFNVYSSNIDSLPLSGSVISNNLNNFTDGKAGHTAFNSDTLQIMVDSWRSFDSLDFLLDITSVSIDSIVAYIYNNVDGVYTSLPVSVGYLDSPAELSSYYVSLSVDLTSIDRAAAPDSTISVVISFSEAASGHYRILSAEGNLFSAPPDPNTKWYQIFLNNITSWFTELDNTVHNGFQDVIAKLDEVFQTSSIQDKVNDMEQAGQDFIDSEKELNDSISSVPEDFDYILNEFVPAIRDYIPSSNGVIALTFLHLYSAFPFFPFFILTVGIYFLFYVLLFRG